MTGNIFNVQKKKLKNVIEREREREWIERDGGRNLTIQADLRSMEDD